MNEAIIKGVIFIIVCYGLLLVYRLARWTLRLLFKATPTNIARAAGRISTQVERKTSTVTQAFKQGRQE